MKKKLYWHTTYGIVEVKERIFKVSGVRLRPFSHSSDVQCRCYSLPLQRVVVDFGADTSFKDAKKKIYEHYAIEIPESSIQKITITHAQKAYDLENDEIKVCKVAAHYLICETDGTMIPIVSFNLDKKVNKSKKTDLRKHRKVFWKEARLCFSRKPDSVSRIFSAVYGSVDATGDAMYRTACRSGFGELTHIHGVGDGAPWIVDQFDRVFSTQATYLIDFYHLSEYLLEASKIVSPDDPRSWRKKQERRMKKNKSHLVLKDLSKEIKQKDLKNADDPVVACHRYIENRLDYVNYAKAIEKKLPIGSGEIESSHRYVIQKRLKISGAWWKESNARAMLSLRVLRANDDWDNYWTQVEREAA